MVFESERNKNYEHMSNHPLILESIEYNEPSRYASRTMSNES